MKFYIINGSPRRNNNTAKMLNKVEEGIKSQTTENTTVETINLYQLNYKGCMSCFACKRLGGPFFRKCPINDDLKPILEKLWDADGIIIGSPIYFSDLTGQTRSFIERLLFPKAPYTDEPGADKKMPVGLIFTMNANHEISDKVYKEQLFAPLQSYIENIFTKPHTVIAYDTYQFNDYSLYENTIFKEEDKAKVRDEQFPQDLENAYNLGVTIVKEAKEL